MARAVGIASQNALEPSQELGNSLFAKSLCPAERFRLLVFVIEIAAQRMMRIVGLIDEIGDGELDLVDPKPLRLVSRSEVVAVAEIAFRIKRQFEEWSK